MTKTALIVDDSPLALHVLSKLLAEHEIQADTAPSAEEALTYLKLHRPDVVFMDHLMPGMDGFEAIKAIKANPTTATIPVMMYTSQEGALYVGQARALGAFGVLPKDLKPIEVTRVLRALRLIPGGEPAEGTNAPNHALPSPHDARSTETSGSHDAGSLADTQQVKALLEELFHQQRSALREEIRESYGRAIASTQEQQSDSTQTAAPEHRGAVLRVATIALAALSLILGILYVNSVELLSDANQRSGELLEQNAALSSLAPGTAALSTNGGSSSSLLDALEWAMNLSGHYAFLEVPLDDLRADQLSRLVDYLKNAEFTGTVTIEVHAGAFCMRLTSDGRWNLAPDDSLASNCDQIGWPQAEAAALSRRQSLSFANVLATASTDGDILIQTVPVGSVDPVISYPPQSDFVTAGEWNQIAAQNQRVAVRLFAD
jgi:CheY-like chemotaxis protein